MEKEISDLKDEIKHLKTQLTRQRATVTIREEEIANLAHTIENLHRTRGYTEIIIGDSDYVPLQEPIWDDSDSVNRCTKCNHEVIYGFCTNCAQEHEYESDDDGDELENTIATDDMSLRSTRSLAPRGTTPRRCVTEDTTPPTTFTGRATEYKSLLRRGATRLMISTFNMEYRKRTGIVAWADDDMYAKWTTPVMQLGDYWKIMLGRVIRLDPDDLDGSIWLNDFLEDALSCPNLNWETKLKSPGIWVTKPTEAALDRLARLEEDEEWDNSENGLDSDREEVEGYRSDDRQTIQNFASNPLDPILRRDDYEDDGADEDSEVEIDTCFFEKPDTTWVSEDEDYEMENETGGLQAVKVEPKEETMDVTQEKEGTVDSDMPGSDWDSQEELSGDEL